GSPLPGNTIVLKIDSGSTPNLAASFNASFPCSIQLKDVSSYPILCWSITSSQLVFFSLVFFFFFAIYSSSYYNLIILNNSTINIILTYIYINLKFSAKYEHYCEY